MVTPLSQASKPDLDCWELCAGCRCSVLPGWWLSLTVPGLSPVISAGSGSDRALQRSRGPLQAGCVPAAEEDG